MDIFRKWNPVDDLEGTDALLNSGAVPEDADFSLEDILKEYGADTQPAPMKEAQRRPLPALEELPVELESPPVEEPEPPVEPEIAPILTEVLSLEPPAEPVPEEEPKPDAEVESVTETEPTTEAAPAPQPEPLSTPEETAPEEPVSETAPVSEPVSEAAPASEQNESSEAAAEKDSNVVQLPVQQAAEEPENASEEETEEPMDSNATAAFIGQQVTRAINQQEDEPAEHNTTVNGLRQFFVEARRRTAEKKLRREQRLREKAAAAALAEAAAAVVEEQAEEQAEDKVVAMPVSPMQPLRRSFGKIQDKANDFADNMYNQAGTAADDAQGTYVSPIDTEEEEDESAPRRAGTAPRPQKRYARSPDTSAEELASRYRLGLQFMRQRIIYVLLISLIPLYLSVAPSLSLPLPQVLTGHRVASAILTWMLAFGTAVGLDVVWLGLTAPFRGRPGMHTLTAAAIIATLIDGVYATFLGRDGPLPFSAIALLGLFFAMIGAYQRKLALYLSCRTAAGAGEPYRVTLDAGKWKNLPAFHKEAGSAKDFGSQIQSPDGSERIYRSCVPIILVAAVAGAVIASLGRGRPAMLTWCLSAILVAAAPLTGLMAFGLPYLRLTRRLDRSGAVLAGWDGVASMTGKANILVKDEDLFPEGSIIMKSIKHADDISLEKLTGCTASMLRAAGSGLYHLFDSELRRQGGFYRRVDDLQCYEAGGLSADIRGEQVLVGTSGFMTVMDINLDGGIKAKRAVYCVINRRLQGIFFLDYDMSHYARTSIDALVRGGVRPVLVTRDFNVLPSMLQKVFGLPVEEMEYPPIDRRRELSEPGQPHNPVLGALLTREGMGAYSDAVIGGRRLHTVVRLNAILTVFASVLGAVIAFLLTGMLAFDSLSPLTMLAFQLLWAVPTLAISGIVDRF